MNHAKGFARERGKENNKEVIVEKIKELEFDAIGNATKSFKIKLPSNQQYLITRNFEYYD